MRQFIKSFAEKIPSSIFERLMALSLLNENFTNVRSMPKFKTREDLWKDVFRNFQDWIVVFEILRPSRRFRV